MKASRSKQKNQGEVTRYTHQEVHETRVPETGHTPLLPVEEEVVDLVMENGWARGFKVGTRSDLSRPLLVDMDPMVDPVLFWSGKRSKRTIPVLPLQRNEIVSESKIRQIVETARGASLKEKGQTRLPAYFAELEKSLRESDRDRRVEFYTHDGGWKNKLVCGDSLLAMEALLKYEGLRGQVQTIFIDPPYGVSYNTNFQQRVDSTKNDEEGQADDVLTVKAYRDTWSLGVHSYLSHLQERLYLCRELLTDSGSIFVQMGDENLHHVRELLDEVFGRRNFVSQILFRKTGGLKRSGLSSVGDYLLWYAKDIEQVKFRRLYLTKRPGEPGATQYRYRVTKDGGVEEIPPDELGQCSPEEVVTHDNLTSQGNPVYEYVFRGHPYKGSYKPPPSSMDELVRAGRVIAIGNTLRYVRRMSDFPFFELNELWEDVGISGFSDKKVYVVQTSPTVVERCILLSTDPGDLILDPTCGSGTTAVCAEKWGRRWLTFDTSRVAINVARQRLLSSQFEHFRTRNGSVSNGFVCRTVPRITLKSLANHLEPEKVELLDSPEVVKGAVRVTGPFELLTVGRYSVEDWKGSFSEGGTVENYINVICRLYRKDAALQTSKGLIHAIVESQKEKFAISVGPISGRVTAKQLNDVAQDALACGFLEAHILGWAFEANVGEIKSKLEAQGRVKINLVTIRPDTLMEGLKTNQPGMLFSPLSLPDIRIASVKSGSTSAEYTLTLEGVGVFDREKRITDYRTANSGYVAAWYLDEDYDGDCFVDCQMFFDFKRVPNLSSILEGHPDPEEFTLKTESAPFSAGKYRRVAVKVVDVYGNESTVIKPLPES